MDNMVADLYEEVHVMKTKRLVILVTCLLIFASTTYAATNLVVTNQSKFYPSAIEKEKTLKYNYGTLNITAGPIRLRDSVYAYFRCTEDENYKSQTLLFDMPASKQLFYNPFDYNTFCGKKYTIYAKVMPYSYSTSMTVQGDFTP